MIVIIAGGRDLWVSPEFIFDSLKNFRVTINDITEIVCGEARGIDTCGKNFARKYNIKVASFLADWEKYKKGAGPRRNNDMSRYGTHLLLLWDGRSSGSHNMKQQMIRRHKPIMEVVLRQQ